MQSPSSHKSMPRQVRRRHKPLDRVDLTGQVVAGRYAVTGLLGHGSMGFVYRAVDQNLKSDVVIKVPAEDRLENPGFLERFHRESSFLVRLRHPHIISILDAGQVEDVPYFVMQYVGGGSLEDRQRQQDGMRRPMSRRSLAQWLPQIGAALDFMHSQDCVHRDVKPANILFDDHGNPYLSDFGLSKVVLTADEDSSSTAAGAVVGTPNYVAPELVLGRDFDGQADQYSLALPVNNFSTKCSLVYASSEVLMGKEDRSSTLCRISFNARTTSDLPDCRGILRQASGKIARQMRFNLGGLCGSFSRRSMRSVAAWNA